MKKMLLGDFAIARGAYEAGVHVATAYPGTPSTEITEELSRFPEIKSEWSPNEKVALEVAIGSSFHGARTIVGMKHVGLNVAADPLFTVAYTGVNGGLVICVADDPSMFSSQNEQDTRLIARAANVPVLEPSDSQEGKDFAALAFDISEQYDTPVILRVTTRVAHSQSMVEIGERKEVPVKPYVKDIGKYVMMPANAKKRHIVVEERLKKLSEDSNTFAINRKEMRDTKIGVICAGGVYQYVREALPDASVYKLGMVYPLPYKALREFVGSVEKCYVIEELEGHIEGLMKANGITDVEGKSIFGIQGEFSVNLIREKGGVVDTWIITHGHDDHSGVLASVLEAEWDKSQIQINRILIGEMDYESIKDQSPRSDAYGYLLMGLNQRENVTWLKAGDETEVLGLKMKVLHTMNDMVYENSDNYLNDGSMIFKLSGNKKSMLFLGDTADNSQEIHDGLLNPAEGSEIGKLLMEELVTNYKDDLPSTVVQMSHHGNGSMPDAFYELVHPKCAFFDAPDWLMENKNMESGENSYYSTPHYVKLMQDMGAKIISYSTKKRSVNLR